MNKIKRIKELVEQLNHYRNAYYNNQVSEISDFEYDKLFDELSALEQETGFVMAVSPTQTVGYEVKSELVKVKHNHPMLSLDKTKSLDDIARFLGNRGFVIMPKMDGLTCSIRYLNGKIVSAETRGDGETGESVLHNIMVVKNIPLQIDYKDELIVDGEIVITDDDFNSINNGLPDEEKYKNSRNLASGSIRQLDSSVAAKRNLKFVAWKCITPINIEKASNNSFSWRLSQLSKFGFEVVEYSLARLDALLKFPQYRDNNITDAKVPLEALVNPIREWAKRNGYQIDGCVFGYEDIAYGESLGATGHHLRSQIAYKFYDELYETKLLDIEWTMGKTHTLTPTAIFQTVNIDGTDVSKASLHNISIIKKLGLTNNCTVRVYKANQIIPQIDSCLQDGNSTIEIPKSCPVCGGTTAIVKENETEVLVCANSNCSGKLLGRLKFFVSKPAMNIDGLSEATLDFLINKGWVKSFKDVYHLAVYKDEWQRYDGFGKKSVEKMLDAIEKSRNIDLANFICSLSIDGIGTSASKTIANAFNGSFDAFFYALIMNYDWSKLTDFGAITARNIADYGAKFSDEVYALAQEMQFVQRESKVVVENPFNGKTLCVTGKLNSFTRDSINAKITELGAKAAGSVSKNTDYLITNEQSSSSKYKKAVELNVPIITEEEFLKMIGE